MESAFLEKNSCNVSRFEQDQKRSVTHERVWQIPIKYQGMVRCHQNGSNGRTRVTVATTIIVKGTQYIVSRTA